MLCEHIVYPALWIDNARYTVSIPDRDGRLHVFGYCALYPEDLADSLNIRVCDIQEWHYLRPENWNKDLVLIWRQYDSDGQQTGQMNLSLEETHNHIRKHTNQFYKDAYNQSQSIAD
jgi:hypothetical protein